MALRPRLQPTLETIQEFELAAEERYWAGLELMTRGDALTDIYILGYVAEMLLKNSYFFAECGNTTYLSGRVTACTGKARDVDLSSTVQVQKLS